MDYAWLLLSFKGHINRARYLVVQLARSRSGSYFC